MAKTTERIQLAPIQIETLKVRIKGTSSLLMNRFSDKSKETMLNKQLKKNIKQREARNIEEELAGAIHRLPNGKVGIPTTGFKNGMIEMAPYIPGLDMKKIKGSVFVLSPNGTDLVPLNYKRQTINESICKLNKKVPIVKYRPEFHDWDCELLIRYNTSQVSADHILNLLVLDGFHNGIGDWRPQCRGVHGMFAVESC